MILSFFIFLSILVVHTSIIYISELLTIYSFKFERTKHISVIFHILMTFTSIGFILNYFVNEKLSPIGIKVDFSTIGLLTIFILYHIFYRFRRWENTIKTGR